MVEKLILCFMMGMYLGGHLAETTEMSPGDQAKVQASLAAVEKVLDETGNFLKSTDAATKVAPVIGAAVKTLSFFAPVLDVVFTFVMPSELDVIKRQFAVVHEKIDAISNQIARVHEELKSSIEFNAWHTTYIDSDFASEMVQQS